MNRDDCGSKCHADGYTPLDCACGCGPTFSDPPAFPDRELVEVIIETERRMWHEIARPDADGMADLEAWLPADASPERDVN